jgi:hypothetical protein
VFELHEDGDDETDDGEYVNPGISGLGDPEDMGTKIVGLAACSWTDGNDEVEVACTSVLLVPSDWSPKSGYGYEAVSKAFAIAPEGSVVALLIVRWFRETRLGPFTDTLAAAVSSIVAELALADGQLMYSVGEETVMFKEGSVWQRAIAR